MPGSFALMFGESGRSGARGRAVLVLRVGAGHGERPESARAAEAAHAPAWRLTSAKHAESANSIFSHEHSGYFGRKVSLASKVEKSFGIMAPGHEPTAP